MGKTTWQQLLGMGLIFIIAGAGTAALNILRSPWPGYGLMAWGAVMALAGLAQRGKSA